MKWIYSKSAVAVAILLLLAVRIADPTALQSLRSQVFDSYQQFDTIVDSNDVAIINIGEKSLQALGQYPFPRTTYAQLIHDIRQKNQGIIGFTIMFPEQDRFAGDEVFASWIKDNGIVLSKRPQTATTVIPRRPIVRCAWDWLSDKAPRWLAKTAGRYPRRAS